MTLIVIAAIGIGASGVLAQDTGAATPTPYPTGTPGYTWNMHGMMWGHRQGDPMRAAVADALGIDVNTLFTDLQSGKDPGSNCRSAWRGCTDSLRCADGDDRPHERDGHGSVKTTQAQADAYQVWMRDNMAQMPMFNDAGYGPGMMGGMMGGYGPGMMGQGK